jgi:hypothetical protein
MDAGRVDGSRRKTSEKIIVTADGDTKKQSALSEFQLTDETGQNNQNLSDEFSQ